MATMRQGQGGGDASAQGTPPGDPGSRGKVCWGGRHVVGLCVGIDAYQQMGTLSNAVRDAEAVDWSALTDTKMTVVVYMGMTAAPAVRAGLLAAARSPQTPVGVFARVTRPDAQAAVGTLDQLPDLVGQIDGGPAILIIGDVVAHSAPWRQKNLSGVIAKLLEPV